MPETIAHPRILIIDDNKAIHTDFRKILADEDTVSSLDDFEAALFDSSPDADPTPKRPHYRLGSAYQGQEGLASVEQALADKDPYSLAFVDVRMPPGWDGIETISHLWKADPHLQVVICTAFSDYSWDEIRGRLSHLENFLILKKPFDVIEVRQLACSLVEKWTLSRTLRGRLCDLESLVGSRTAELSNALSISSATLESTNDALIVVTHDGRILVHNRNFERMWKFPKHLLERGKIQPAFEHIIAQQKDPKAFLEQERSISADDNARHLLETTDGRMIERYVQPYELNGKIIGRVLSFRDITEHFRAEEARRCSDEQWRTIVEHEPDGVQVLDQKGCVLQINPAALATFEETESNLLGAEIVHYVLPEYRDTFREMLKHVLMGEQSKLELEVLTPTGKRRWLDVRAVALATSATSPKVLLMTRDQTEKRIMAQQLQQAQKIEAIGLLAGGVAHDFNNLLTVINGQCQMLLGNSAAGPKTVESLREILRAGKRAAGLTRQLLAFSRKQLLVPKVVNLNALIIETEKMLRRLIGEDISYSFHQQPDLWSVKVDPNQMMQVLMNLVVNARDAMPSGGQLAVSTRNMPADAIAECTPLIPDAEDYVLLRVSDTGTGIKADDIDRIYDPFFTTKEQGKGTGLGLAMIHGIVKQSGGYIDVKSEPDSGTTFLIFLPRCSETAVSSPDETHPPAPRPPRGEQIILVDDEMAIRRLSREVLFRAGYRVHEADNAHKAEQLFHEHPEIDLLITDVVMPGQNGVDLAIRLRQLRPELGVLFISGYPDDNLDAYGTDNCNIPLLQKPFSPHRLVSTVQELLENGGAPSGLNDEHKVQFAAEEG